MQRVRRAGFVNDEAHEQQAAGQQQSPDQPGVQPVEPVALVERGVDQRQADAAGDEAEPVGRRRAWVDRRDASCRGAGTAS